MLYRQGDCCLDSASHLYAIIAGDIKVYATIEEAEAHRGLPHTMRELLTAAALVHDAVNRARESIMAFQSKIGRKDRAISDMFVETALRLHHVSRANERWRIGIGTFKSEDGQDNFDYWDALYFERIVKLRLKMDRQKRIFSNLREADRDSRVRKHKREVMTTYKGMT